MISKSMAEALNTHMNFELYSANIYLSMSSAANGDGAERGGNLVHGWQYQERWPLYEILYYNLVDQGININLDCQQGRAEQV